MKKYFFTCDGQVATLPFNTQEEALKVAKRYQELDYKFEENRSLVYKVEEREHVVTNTGCAFKRTYNDITLPALADCKPARLDTDKIAKPMRLVLLGDWYIRE